MSDLKKKIKKIIIISFLLFYMFMSIGVVDAIDPSKFGWYKNKEHKNDYYCSGFNQSCFFNDGKTKNSIKAIYVYLVKYHYDSSKATQTKEQIVGKPVLYYNDGFFRNETALENSVESAFASPSKTYFPLTTGAVSASCTGSGDDGSGGGYDTPHGPAIHQDIINNNFNDQTQAWVVSDAAGQGNKCVIDPFVTTVGSEVINTYDGDLRIFKFDDDHVYNDSDIRLFKTGANLNNKENVKAFFDSTIKTNIFSSAKSPTDAINRFFNTGGVVNLTNIEDYYIAVKYAQRYKGNLYSTCGPEISGVQDSLKESPISYIYNCSCNCSGSNVRCSIENPTQIAGERDPVPGAGLCTQEKYEEFEYPSNCDDYDDDDTNDCSSDWRWVPDGKVDATCTYSTCTGYRIHMYNQMTSVENHFYSIISPAHDCGLFTVTTDNAEHKLIKSGSQIKNCTDDSDQCFTEYFIGPSLESALVGKNSTQPDSIYKNTFYYRFADTPNDGKDSASCTLFMWVPETINSYTPCVNAEHAPCTVGDLECAEKFCDNLVGYDDRENAYKMKQDCIVNNCQYKKADNNCSTFYSDKEKQDIVNKAACSTATNKTTSYCSKVSSDSNASAEDTKKEKLTNQWCYNDADNLPIDQKTFINVSCTENSYFTFSDISKIKLTSGVGIDYWTRLNGRKNCTVWFDLDSWVLAYASFHSRETVCTKIVGDTCVEEKQTRKYLIELLDRYNKISKSETERKYGNNFLINQDFTDPMMHTVASLIGDDDHSSDQLSWTQLDYTIDDDRVSIFTTVTEKENDKVINTPNTFELVSEDEPKIVTKIGYGEKRQDHVWSEGKGYSVAQTYDRGATGSVYSNSYVSSGEGTQLYVMQKSCISNDGRGTSSINSGVCYSINVDGEKIEIKGQNKYYTALKPLNSKEKYSVEFYTTAALTKDSNMPNTSQRLINCNESGFIEDDICPNPGHGLDCFITVSDENGSELLDGVYHGENGITAKITVLSDNQNIKSYNIAVGKESEITTTDSTEGLSDKLVVMPRTTTGLEEVTVSGIVVSDVETVTCSKDFKLSKCSVCDLVKLSDSSDDKYYRYKVNWSNASANSLNVSTNKSSEKLTIYKNKDGEFIVSISKSLVGNEGLYLFLSDGVNCCSKFIDPSIPEPQGGGGTNCKTDINPNGDASRSDVASYCNPNYLTDINGYKSPLECINDCWYDCPNIPKCDADSLGVVESFCSDKFGSVEKIEYKQCVSRCYKVYNCPDDGFVFRSISNTDPFPNNRKVGANWTGFEDFIIEDNYDSTAVTGVNADSGQVEYIIDLTPEDIRRIREDTRKNNESNVDAYSDYIREVEKQNKEINDNSDSETINKYRSQFIHKDFSNLFTISSYNSKNGKSDVNE